MSKYLLLLVPIFCLILSVNGFSQNLQIKKDKFQAVAKGKVGQYGFTEVFKSDQNEILLEGTGSRKTKKAAKNEFGNRIKKAEKIIDNVKKIKVKGKISKRVVLDLGKEETYRYLIAIYDQDRDIKYIVGGKLQTVLEFEKWENSQN